MSMNYLLRCECGKDLVVEPQQAGETLSCECGATLAAPPLRKLRELPSAQVEAETQSGSWSFRSGVLTTGLLLAAVLLAVGGYLRMNEPAPPAEFSADRRNDSFAENFGQLNPAQAFLLWGQNYQLIDRVGFTPMQDPRRDAILSVIAKARAIETVLFSAAGVVVLGSFAAFFAIPAGNRAA